MGWRNEKVLITGADHFVAIHLTEQLVKLGSKVKVLIRNDYQGSMGGLERLPAYIRNNIQIIFGNLTNPDIVDYVTKDIDIVFHFGILDSIPSNPINIRGYLEGTLIGTYNVLNSAKNSKVKKLIHISTAEVYGNVKDEIINESCILRAFSPNTGCDIGAEKLVEGFNHLYGMSTTIIRLFNAYGPIQSPRAIIPTIIGQALNETTILLGDMHAIRDFIYVDDVINGIIRSSENSKLSGEAVNLGSGNGISIGDLADKIINLIGREVEVLFDATRIRLQDQNIDKMVADTSKAKELIGWQPKVSLDDGLNMTIEWFAEHMDNR
ncbi:TPA: NAD-dependent epimerase/dehydratase family protein [bacterium]|nr:NAD-dependent epimerase/dehydratase family protein [bacterium]